MSPFGVTGPQWVYVGHKCIYSPPWIHQNRESQKVDTHPVEWNCLIQLQQTSLYQQLNNAINPQDWKLLFFLYICIIWSALFVRIDMVSFKNVLCSCNNHNRGIWVKSLKIGVVYMCVSELGQHWFRQRLGACSAPSLCLNHCWLIVKTNQRILNLNTGIFIQENTFEQIVCKIAGILSKLPVIKYLLWRPLCHHS